MENANFSFALGISTLLKKWWRSELTRKFKPARVQITGLLKAPFHAPRVFLNSSEQKQNEKNNNHEP